MNHKDSFLSPTAIYLLFYDFDVALVFLEKESCWIWILRTNSIQYHNNPFFVRPRKPPDPVKDLYDSQNYDLKTRVNIWTNMDVIPVDYGTFAWIFHLMVRFSQFINGIAFKLDYVLWCIIDILGWIGLWKN